MERDAYHALIDSLAGAGKPGAELQAEFQRLIVDSELESSIFSHEGRHAVDDVIGAKGNVEEREFRAKLSQVVFAPRPRLAIGSLLDESVGGTGSHGKANERIALGLLDWLRRNSASIGVDAGAPLLPQLPLLSDAQLRAAFRALDPLAGR